MRMRVTICVNSAVRPLSEQVQHNITQHRSGDSSFDSEFCLLITTLPFIASEVRGRDRGPPRGSSWWKRVFPWERRSRLRPSSPSSGVWRSVSAGSRREIPPRSSALTRSSTWERGWRTSDIADVEDELAANVKTEAAQDEVMDEDLYDHCICDQW